MRKGRIAQKLFKGENEIEFPFTSFRKFNSSFQKIKYKRLKCKNINMKFLFLDNYRLSYSSKKYFREISCILYPFPQW